MKRPSAPALVAAVCAALMPWALAGADPASSLYGVTGMGDADPAPSQTMVADPDGFALEDAQVLVVGNSALQAPSGTSAVLRNVIVLQEGDGAEESESAVVVEDGADAILVGVTILADNAPAIELADGSYATPSPEAGSSGATIVGSELVSSANAAVDVHVAAPAS